jgi:endoglucanase
MDQTELLLKEITEANGVSGYESEVRAIMERELKGNVDSIETDRMGSIMGVKKGTTDSPRVMVIGHMDEIGFMVKEITKEGYIKFLPLGGCWPTDAHHYLQRADTWRDWLHSAASAPHERP